VKFFKDYPYALATFVAGLVCLTATLSSLLFLKETLKTAPTSDGSKPKPPLSTLEVLKAPGVKMVLFIFSHVTILALGYTAMSPVFLYTPIEYGGLAFKPDQIAMFIALAGFSQAMWMLLAFPPFQRNYGTGSVLRACAMAWPVMMAVYPLLNEFARRGWFTAMWTVGTLNIIAGSAVSMAFGKIAVKISAHDLRPQLTTPSMRSVVLERHLAVSERASDSQCHCADGELRDTSCRPSTIHQHLRFQYQIGLG
jgi:hypothetical protein